MRSQFSVTAPEAWSSSVTVDEFILMSLGVSLIIFILERVV